VISERKTDYGYELNVPAQSEPFTTHLDDAPASPHGSDTRVVQVPVVDLGGLTHEHESLSVRDDLGSVKSLLKVANRQLVAHPNTRAVLTR
jgi:hypothetical protein